LDKKYEKIAAQSEINEVAKEPTIDGFEYKFK